MLKFIYLFINLFIILILDCADGDVKLVGGYGAYEGSVQFCFENVWGLVAQSGWNLADAQVICRQLGYETAGRF